MNLRVFYLTRRGISDGYILNRNALRICRFTSFSVLFHTPQLKKYRQNKRD